MEYDDRLESFTDRSTYGSWQELCQALLFKRTRTFIFRGQPDSSFPLISRLERSLPKSLNSRFKRNMEAEAVTFFAQKAKEIGLQVPSAKLELLQVMQHYGAPTRLLDWTKSAFIALYFAYREPECGRERALFAYNVTANELVYKTPAFYTAEHYAGPYQVSQVDDGVFLPHLSEVSLIEDAAISAIAAGHEWPLVIPPLIPDQRLVAQQAMFTLDPSLSWGPEGMLGRPFPAAPAKEENFSESERRCLVKIPLAEAWRDEVFSTLRKMNISAATLFPGMDGLGEATSNHLTTGEALTFEGRRAALQVRINSDI